MLTPITRALQRKLLEMEEISFRTRSRLTLPMRKSPIRFAVQQTSGITSNAWGVQTENTGDAYVYCRDCMKGQKISLHRSGKQHISFDEEVATQMNSSDRFMNQWREPHYIGEAKPTFKLLFPSWALGLNEVERRNSESAWKKNEILIGGHDDLMTVVSFVIVDDGVRLRKKEGSYPWSLIGDLSLRSGKRLLVVAGWEPEGNWRAVVEEALSKINDPRVVSGGFPGDPLSISLTGYSSPDSAFMVVVGANVRG